MYIIYDMKDNGIVLTFFDTGKEIAAYFGTSIGVIYSTVSRKALVKRRYLIERVT